MVLGLAGVLTLVVVWGAWLLFLASEVKGFVSAPGGVGDVGEVVANANGFLDADVEAETVRILKPAGSGACSGSSDSRVAFSVAAVVEWVGWFGLTGRLLPGADPWGRLLAATFFLPGLPSKLPLSCSLLSSTSVTMSGTVITPCLIEHRK